VSRIGLRERIEQGLLILDGAMGTQLIARGIAPGVCNDNLNVESPEIVLDVQRAYIAAGSEAIITNTFGANKYTLSRHGLGDKAEEINRAGVRLAREAAGDDRYVLGDIGPTGDFLEPLGLLKGDELKEAFAAQARGLADGGADGIIVETMTAVDEAQITVEAVRSVCELPIFVSFAFDPVGDDFRTMMGVDVSGAVSRLAGLGIDAIGFNCGTLSLEGYTRLAAKFVETVSSKSAKVKILAEPNAGRPELVGSQAAYRVSPKDYAAAVEKIYAAGVTIIGGCCGTTPAHIEALARKLK